MSVGEEVVEDYASLRMTLRAHPLRLVRHRLGTAIPSDRLSDVPDASLVTVAGLVLVHQRPGTARVSSL